MEVQIQDLVSSIKKDGIESANKEVSTIIAEAKKQAETILSDANSEAKKMLEDARAEIEIFKSSAQLNAEQAKRDAALAFRNEIQSEFERILANDVRKSLNTQSLAVLIQAILDGKNVSDYAVEVSEVTDELKSELANEIKNGLEICPSKKVQAGFRLAAKDESGYFDCSDEEITEMLMPFFRDIRF